MSTIAETPTDSMGADRLTALKGSDPIQSTERASVRVTQELDSLVQRLQRQLWLGGTCIVTGLAMIVLLALIAVDAILQPQSFVARFSLWVVGFIACGEAIRRSLWRPLRGECSRLSLAWSLEQRHPEIEERLTSTLQFAARQETRSSAFVEAIATQAHSGMASCTDESLAGRSVRNAISMAAICFTIFVLGMLSSPDRLFPSLANVLRPWHERVLPHLNVPILPGDIEVAEGTDVEITVAGRHAGNAVLEILNDAPTSDRDRIRESHTMVSTADNTDAAFLLQSVEQSLFYRVRTGGLYSDIFRLTVHPAPVINELQATLVFPEYTHLESATVDLLSGRQLSEPATIPPTITALPGTRITLTGTASLPIQESTFLRDSQLLNGISAGKENSQHAWSFEINGLPVDSQSLVQQCSVTMISEHGVRSEPCRFEIHVARDLPPVVEIHLPGTELLTMRPDQSFRIPFSALDDFGIRKLEIAIRKGTHDSSFTIIPSPENIEQNEEHLAHRRNGDTTLDLNALDVKPGDTISVWLKASDNRAEQLGGSQSTDSRILSLHITHDAMPMGQQAVQQQHENVQQDLRTAIDHLKTAQVNAERLSQSLLKEITDTADQTSDEESKTSPEPNAEKQIEPQLAQKAAAETREEIHAAREALQRLQDRAKDQPSAMFLSEIERARDVSEQELKTAAQQLSLIPLSDDLKQKQDAADATAKEVDQSVRKLEDIESEMSQRSKDLELAAQLDELAGQQEQLAKRFNQQHLKQQHPDARNQPQEDAAAKPDQQPQDAQPTVGKDQSGDVRQQKDIADALQKIAANDAEARSELFRQRSEEASKLAEETERLKEQQERLSQWRPSEENPDQKSKLDEQLMEMIAKVQESIAQQTRELDQEQEENGRNADSLVKQHERIREAIKAVRENRPDDAASTLQEQIAERTEQVRQKAEELLQRPTDDEENQESLKDAREKLQKAADDTETARRQAANKDAGMTKDAKNDSTRNNETEPQDPMAQPQRDKKATPAEQTPEQAQQQQAQQQQAQQQQAQQQQAQQQQPPKEKAAEQQSKAAKSLEEAAKSLQSVCKSCQNCANCNKSTGSSGSGSKSGNANKDDNASKPKNGPLQEDGDKKQLAKAAEKASQTAKNPTANGAKKLSDDLNQLADRAAKKSLYPGRRLNSPDKERADSKQANKEKSDKDGQSGKNGQQNNEGKNGEPKKNGSQKPGDQSKPNAASDGKPSGKSNEPPGATGNAMSSDQLDSPEQLRGPATSNWTRSRRMLNGSVLDARDAKMPQEYRAVVEDYFEQLSRIESKSQNATSEESSDDKSGDTLEKKQ